MVTEPAELPRRWYALTRFALWCFTLGPSLIATTLVAWWLMLPRPRPSFAVETIDFDRWTLAFGLVALGIGLAAWMRALSRTANGVGRGAFRELRRTMPLLAIFLGVTLITVTGYREVHDTAAGTPQVLHAVLGIGSVLLILAGLVTSRRACAPLIELFDVGSVIRVATRALLFVSYAALGLGTLVPFTPTFFDDGTPWAIAVRIAGTGALLFAIPLAMVAVVSFLLLWRLCTCRRLIPVCTRCGYPRPAGKTCPECGADS
jgi:hypothetical protein